jgi:hypothetical protein
MTPALNKAATKAHILDDTIQEILVRQDLKDKRFRLWAGILLTLVLSLGIIGIYRQNQIATKNQQHIDCIVKLFTTSLPTTAHARIITNPSTTCDIKFTQ